MNLSCSITQGLCPTLNFRKNMSPTSLIVRAVDMIPSSQSPHVSSPSLLRSPHVFSPSLLRLPSCSETPLSASSPAHMGHFLRICILGRTGDEELFRPSSLQVPSPSINIMSGTLCRHPMCISTSQATTQLTRMWKQRQWFLPLTFP